MTNKTATVLDVLKIDDSKLTTEQLQVFYRRTPESKILRRTGKGGSTWKYVSGSYVKQVLNSMFGVEWTFSVDTSLEEAFNVAKITRQCVVKGTLTVPIGDKLVSRTQFGRCDVKFLTEKVNGISIPRIDDFSGLPMTLDFGNDMKGAATDALKKCANELGLFADVYSNDDFLEVKIIEPTIEDVGASEQSKKEILESHGKNS